MKTVTIGGVTPDQVLEVRTSRSKGDELGEAYVDLVDTPTNRSQFAPADAVEIDWGTGVGWRGEVAGQPSTSSGTLTYRCLGEAIPLKHVQAYRVFYNADKQTAIENLIAEETEQLAEVTVADGTAPGDWRSTAPIAEPYAGERASLSRRGNDLLVIGAREGRTGSFHTTHENVSSDAITDGIFELEIRLLVPQAATQWNTEVHLHTPSGTGYRWDVDLEGGRHTYTLPAEQATPDIDDVATGELRLEFTPAGIIPNLTCIGIDYISTYPFATSSRSNPLTADIEAPDKTVTRRIDGSVGAAVETFATEDAADWYVEDDTAIYRPGSSDELASLSIDSSTPIRNVDVDRDYESVVNVATFQGADGIEVTESVQSSIDFYNGEFPRSEPLRDPSVTTEAAARDRLQGYLADAAWKDADVSFTIADLTYAQLTAGQRVDVTYPPETLDGRYRIDRVEASSTGTVDVDISASTALA